MRVVAIVVATSGTLHDPAVRVGEALLGAVLGHAEVALVAPAFGLAVLVARLAFIVLAAATCFIGLLLTLLQPQLGLADGLETVFPALDLPGQVYLGLVLLQVVGGP